MRYSGRPPPLQSFSAEARDVGMTSKVPQGEGPPAGKRRPPHKMPVRLPFTSEAPQRQDTKTASAFQEHHGSTSKASYQSSRHPFTPIQTQRVETLQILDPLLTFGCGLGASTGCLASTRPSPFAPFPLFPPCFGPRLSWGVPGLAATPFCSACSGGGGGSGVLAFQSLSSDCKQSFKVNKIKMAGK